MLPGGSLIPSQLARTEGNRAVVLQNGTLHINGDVPFCGARRRLLSLTYFHYTYNLLP